jgi:hypothetical protein
MSFRYSIKPPIFLNAVCECGAEVSCLDVKFDGETISGRAEHRCTTNIFREWQEEVVVFPMRSQNALGGNRRSGFR